MLSWPCDAARRDWRGPGEEVCPWGTSEVTTVPPDPVPEPEPSTAHATTVAEECALQSHPSVAQEEWLEDEIDLRVYIEVLRRWLWLIAAGLVVGASVAYAFTGLQPPVYRASARLLVQQQIGEVPAQVTSEELHISQSLAATYAELLKSRSLLNATLMRLGLSPVQGDEEPPFSLQVAPVRNTHILQIDVDSAVPELAVMAAGVLPEVFIEQQAQMAAGQFGESREAFEAQLTQLDREIGRILQEIEDLGEGDEARTIRLQDQLTQYRAMHSSLFQKLQEVNLAQSRILPPVSVVERPQMPPERVGPRQMMATAVGGSLGLMIAVFGAFFLEFVRDRFRDSQEVERLLDLPVLGSIPYFKADEKESGRKHPQLASPRSPRAEAYRLLRTNLQFAAVDQPVSSVTVTSPEPNAGKTTTVVNLGVALAQADRSVVLVEADLRRPALGKALGLPAGRPGLADVLVGTAQLEACLQEPRDWPGYRAGRLRVLTAGTKLPPGPTELLESRRMQALIEELTGLADIVVFDAPPVLAAADAAVLGTRTGGVLFVVDTRQSKRRVAQQARENLLRGKLRLLGAVLTRVNARGSGYYYYYQTHPRKEPWQWAGRVVQWAGVSRLAAVGLVAVGIAAAMAPRSLASWASPAALGQPRAAPATETRPAATATTMLVPIVTVATATKMPTPAASAQPSATATASPAAVPTPLTYTVRAGDNLTRIAEAHGVSVEALAAENDLVSPSAITVGQVLVVPRGAGATEKAGE